jgi:hypothetical protein
MMTTPEWGRLAEDEANALVQLLESPDRKVEVIVIAVEGDEIALCRAVSKETTAHHGRAFIMAIERERDRLAGKLIGRSAS